jgi:hypothetical protein
MSKLEDLCRRLALLILLAGTGYAAAVYFTEKGQRRRWRYRKRTPILYRYRCSQFNLDTWPDERICQLLQEEIQTLVLLLHLEDVEYPWSSVGRVKSRTRRLQWSQSWSHL